MSLIKCRECSREISSSAEKCPHCGAKNKKGSNGCAVLIVALFGLTLVVWLAGVWAEPTSGARSVPPATAKSRLLDIDVAYDDTTIALTNTAHADWISAEVYLNGRPPDTFHAKVAAPKPGTTIHIPLTQFIHRDGRRFNPVTHAVTEIWVGGSGYDFSKYDARR